MDNLPDPGDTPGNTSINTDTTTPQPTGGISSKEKEEFGVSGLEAPALKEFGREAALPSEAAAAGVKLHPTTVTVPQPVASLGVKPVGDTATSQSAPTVTLPLNDDQIAKGLHQSITSSWRWLAEWCMRKIKQIRKIIKK